MNLYAGQGMKLVVEGQEYEVAHSFNESRALINFDGLYTFVDRAPDGTWELSGLPARPDEKPILDALIAPMKDKSIVTVIKD